MANVVNCALLIPVSYLLHFDFRAASRQLHLPLIGFAGRKIAPLAITSTCVCVCARAYVLCVRAINREWLLDIYTQFQSHSYTHTLTYWMLVDTNEIEPMPRRDSKRKCQHKLSRKYLMINAHLSVLTRLILIGNIPWPITNNYWKQVIYAKMTLKPGKISQRFP